MKFEIKNRWTGSVIFETEAVSLKAAVEKAAETRVCLRAADLRAANLSAANLSDANLSAANLSAANLRDADLSDANLSAADLSAANLSAANLSAANLRAADLSAADLRAADLRAANLRDADLSDADLSAAKNDFFAVLLAVKKEVAGLREALVAGKVNGSTYEGECACLVGTIANIQHCDYRNVPNLKPDSSRPIETFFTAIRIGDTPDKNAAAKIAVEWIDEFQMLLNAE